MLTKQARLWYNETLYWENGANAPFQSAVMIPAFPRNYKWVRAKTNNRAERVKIPGEPFPEEKHGENAKRKA